ncbi:MscS Mechanosensitive ion channel [Beutenbergia cavernae DSM 12333]|uniref:MscS Mechanosensitive ion channel n=1 Tax=Beutenbergia cavernae (strain ATCC BAA-8 / DSM 12333 / CCUG 43141 / JCM 11478 / NBRC 16432 / NCIMB 13614 / HKI 0122) TaxID=471853 RepID=C5BXJ6_BEUC1|nr:mechanosensitive ion channel domain-containing protein [Beutenbergia cavernae]ACQ80879.1 MscS Mechanosensitive ion channel [Beutenbergia cavernae DSM 12333]
MSHVFAQGNGEASSLATDGLRALVIVLIGAAVLALLRFLLSRVMRGLRKAPSLVVEKTDTALVTLGSVKPSEAKKKRLSTLESVIRSTITVLVVTVVFFMVLAAFGVDITPLLASAGIVGVALAFGAQSLVKDIVSGLFMLFENQYAVGDRIELGTAGGTLATGVVEAVELRITTIRDDDGRLWYVRNGEVLRVANESQGWALAAVDVAVAVDQDLDKVREEVARIVQGVVAESGMADVVQDPTPTIRFSALSAGAVTIEVRLRAKPGQKWRLASELRHRISRGFTEADIRLA